MSGRRLSLSHVVAEDRGGESGVPALSNRRGQMVQGFATFYIKATGWYELPPGRLEIAELHGGASGFGAGQTISLASVVGVNRAGVEFYLYADGPRAQNFVALNGDVGDVFTFGFFGRRFS